VSSPSQTTTSACTASTASLGLRITGRFPPRPGDTTGRSPDPRPVALRDQVRLEPTHAIRSVRAGGLGGRRSARGEMDVRQPWRACCLLALPAVMPRPGTHSLRRAISAHSVVAADLLRAVLLRARFSREACDLGRYWTLRMLAHGGDSLDQGSVPVVAESARGTSPVCIGRPRNDSIIASIACAHRVQLPTTRRRVTGCDGTHPWASQSSFRTFSVDHAALPTASTLDSASRLAWRARHRLSRGPQPGLPTPRQ